MSAKKIPLLAWPLNMLFALWCFCVSAVAVANEPPRVVVAGGSVTEIVYALGRGEWVVATDSTSLFPVDASKVPKLGYFRQLSTEGVLAQRPSLLLGANATGPESMLRQIEKAGVRVRIFNVSNDLNGLLEMVMAIGTEVSAEYEAKLLVDEIVTQVEHQKADFLQQTKQYPANVKALFVVATNDRGVTVAGDHTVPQALFNTLGITNIAADLDNYKLMDTESILARNPDIIFVAGHMLHGENALASLCSHPAIKTTFAGRHCLVKAIDSNLGLGLSPRFGLALQAVGSHALRAIAIKLKGDNNGTAHNARINPVARERASL